MSESDNYDRQQWQAEQEARDAAASKQRDKMAKARERSARNARRKLERLHRTLKDSDDLTEFEEEFAESVTERLDQFGSAFRDLEKGRPGDALSAAQKRVVAAMNRKVKDAKRAQRAQGGQGEDSDADGENDEPRRSTFKPRSSFKSKRAYTPRVRQLDEEFEDEPAPSEAVTSPVPEASEPERPPVGRPFLRVIDNTRSQG